MIVILLNLWMVVSGSALAQAPPGTAGTGAKRLDVEQIKKQYWGQEESFEVVQNRLYTKAGRVELGFIGLINSVDPFQTVVAPGFTLAYHFSEYWAFEATAWRNFSTPSDAVPALTAANAVANTNIPAWLVAGNINYSPVYGKLSLVGKAILYYDLHVSAGLGNIWTETGPYLTQLFGVGQQLYLSKNFSLRVEYKGMHYFESVLGKNPLQPTYGQIVLQRHAWSHNFMVGISLLIP